MTNGQIYVFISIACVLVIGSWAVVISVMLDRARAEIKKQNLLIARLVEPPF